MPPGLLSQPAGCPPRALRVRLMPVDLMFSGRAVPEPVLRELEALAVTAAGAAGRFIVDDRPRGMGVLDTKSSVNDIVTVMDQESELLLRRILLGARPDDAILGEEDLSLIHISEP